MDDIAIGETVAKKLTEYNRELTNQRSDLESAQREAASPVKDAVDDLRSVAGLLAADKSDEIRRRVQAAIRRIVDRVRILPVALAVRHKAFVVLVQFSSAEKRFRLYLIRPGEGRGVYRVDPPTRTWLTNTLDIRTAEGRERAERFVRELVNRTEKTSQSAKASEVGTDAGTGGQRIDAEREDAFADRARLPREERRGKRIDAEHKEAVAGFRAARSQISDPVQKRTAQRRKAKR